LVQGRGKMHSPIEDIFPIQRDIDDHIDDFEAIDLI
jgi:hypothetical protein